MEPQFLKRPFDLNFNWASALESYNDLKKRVLAARNSRLTQTLFEFQRHIDDIPRVFTSSREQIFGASIFRSPIYHLIKSQSNLLCQSNSISPQNISKLSLQTAMYIQFQSWQMLDQWHKKYRILNLLCHIVIDNWASCLLPEMVNVYDNHIQGWFETQIRLTYSPAYTLPPRRWSWLSKSLVANTFNFDDDAICIKVVTLLSVRAVRRNIIIGAK